jgi:hypothetical protein
MTLFEHVRWATNVKLSVTVSPPVEEQRLRWTTYSNLQMWSLNFWAFLLEKEFAREGEGEDELVFDDEQLRRIGNIDKTEISLNGSKMNAEGRPPISYCDRSLPMASWSVA